MFSKLGWIALLSTLASAQVAEYKLAQDVRRPSVVSSFTVTLAPVHDGARWVSLHARKHSGAHFGLWILATGEPRSALVQRYILREGDAQPREYRNELTGLAALPASGVWDYLPSPLLALPPELTAFGHHYRRVNSQPPATDISHPSATVVNLRPDLLIGQASNTRQQDETRRYDGSDYQLIPLTRDDYRQMRDAGITCVRVDATQLPWADELGLFYWGGGPDLPFPEALLRSQYLGPALYLDEPAVGTRDHVVRPRFEKDPAFRKAITPQLMLEEFRKYYDHAWREGSPTALMKSLRARPDIDLGDMDFRQANLYTWETMVSTAAHQLSQDPRVPQAIVFEPPGRIGTRRTLPEMDMTYGVQLPPDDPKALASIIFGFLRGAARVTNKQWGISIYGAFDQSDAPWWLTHAYDLGATRFFFWDNYQLACVPFHEVLAHARHLREHARSHPRPSPTQLRRAAELAILLPPGYDLGHVQTGKGNLWGVGELNLERRNAHGVAYRTVMSNFFTEIERAFKAGVRFDLLWDLPNLDLSGYHQIIRIREDNGALAAIPPRSGGPPPELAVTASASGRAITAQARVTETAAKVFYTFGADSEGVYRNALVAWELYGPEEQDQIVLLPEKLKPEVTLDDQGGTVHLNIPVSRPGNYRIRAATVDTAGRSTVVWTPVAVN